MSRKATHQVDKEIGTRVRLRRAQIGMSQAELGAALGVPYQQIQEYENGTDRISVSRLNLIAGTLGVDPAFFLPEVRRPRLARACTQPQG